MEEEKDGGTLKKMSRNSQVAYGVRPGEASNFSFQLGLD